MRSLTCHTLLPISVFAVASCATATVSEVSIHRDAEPEAVWVFEIATLSPGARVKLGYRLGPKSFELAELVAGPRGRLVFRNDPPQPSGEYILATPDGVVLLEFLGGERDIHLRSSGDGNLVVVESRENQLLRDFAFAVEGLSGTRLAAAQRQAAAAHPTTLFAAILRTSIAPAPSSVTAPLLDSYINETDLADPRLIRTRWLLARVDHLLDTLTAQSPEAVIVTLAKLLERPSDPQVWQLVLAHVLNKYAASRTMCFDTVYAWLVEAYYASGKAAWVSADTLAKMRSGAAREARVRCGQKAPDLTVTDLVSLQFGHAYPLLPEEGAPVVLAVVAVDPGLGEPLIDAQEPALVALAEEFSSRGVRFVAALAMPVDRLRPPRRWGGDPRLPPLRLWDKVFALSGEPIGATYPLTSSSPAIYVLDRDLVIRGKRIGADQVRQVLVPLLHESAAP